MVAASGVRLEWTDIPPAVRQGIERLLGGKVTQAKSQSGGFSPGTADRILLEDGRRAFVKAAHPGLNEQTVALHRREARIAGILPDAVPVPELLGTYDDGTWVALLFEDVPGRHPLVPWRPDELAATLAMLDTLAQATTPTPLDLPETLDETCARTISSSAPAAA